MAALETEFLRWTGTLSADVQSLENKVIIEGLTIYFVPLRHYARYPIEDKGSALVVWEDIWASKKALVKARICSLLNRNKVISARDTQVIHLDKPRSDAFLQSNHLMGSAKVKYKYGLLYKGVLVAVALFSAIKTYYRGTGPSRSSELVRYSSMDGINVAGGLSKLLEHFIAQSKVEDIMTYADLEWSNGELYQTLGFHFVERTDPKVFWVHPTELIRCSAEYLLQQWEVKEGDKCAKEQVLLVNGYYQIFNAGNLKYLLPIIKLGNER